MMSRKAVTWMIELAARVLIRATLAILLVAATVVLFMGIRGRALPDLQPWHTSAPTGEFEDGDETAEFGFADYLEIERRLFAQLGDYRIDGDDLGGFSKYIRFVEGGPHSPQRFEPNWNRSFELVPQEITGGVLMIHGLSDSPYSMRSLATTFHGEGFYVLGMRMPGHGTVPAALLDVSYKDWAAAVRIGARHVRSRVGDDAPFHVCGYSNGGALAVLYTLEAVKDDDLPRPDKVFLFSPAIGITRLAFASNWHKAISWIPFFRKSKWLNLKPEIEPFKYNSFTKNGGAQAWTLAGAVQKKLTAATVEGKLHDLPPIMTFQSVADSTIIAADVVTRLYDRLPDNGSELIVFDINRFADLDGFYRQNYRRSLRDIEEGAASRAYGVTVITNVDADSFDIVARTVSPGAPDMRVEPLDLHWPKQVYSLAHVAIPFPPDDPVYGTGPRDGSSTRLFLGDLSLRGEIGVMIIPTDELMRLRHNPFHAYMISRIRRSIASTAGD